MTFVEHARRVAVSAKGAVAALGRLMPNFGGQSQCKRQLLMSVVHSRLLYGAQVWADAMSEVGRSKGFLQQAQRCAALKVARCYRTVSDVAATLLARMQPAPLLASERVRNAELKKAGTPHTKAELRKEVIRQWQIAWEQTTKASWTKRLIPDVARWWHNGPWAAPGPGDVADLMCLPSPPPHDLPPDAQRRRRILAAARVNSNLFHKMVEEIMGRKEELERIRQMAEAARQP